MKIIKIFFIIFKNKINQIYIYNYFYEFNIMITTYIINIDNDIIIFIIIYF